MERERRMNQKIKLGIALTLFALAGIITYFYSCRKEEPVYPPGVTPPKGAPGKPAQSAQPVKTASKFKEVVEKYDTGETKAKYLVHADKPEIKHGLYTEFYKSGKKKYECSYAENALEGKFAFYYEDGKNAMTGAFKKGNRDGVFAEWHESGNKKLDYAYVDGKLDGLWTEWYDAPQKKMTEKAFKAGSQIGTMKTYKLDGTVKAETMITKDAMPGAPDVGAKPEAPKPGAPPQPPGPGGPGAAPMPPGAPPPIPPPPGNMPPPAKK